MSFYDCQSLLDSLFTAFLNSKGFLLTVVIILVVLTLIIYINRRRIKYMNICDIQAFSITIKLDKRNIDIAYMMYIQLRTRKIGLPFEDNDVIKEVYDSWYSAFQSIRELLMNVRPVPTNKKLIDVGMMILNIGMRPHLTKWQAKFRKWYDVEVQKEQNKALTPQEIQKKYPLYEELVKDIRISQTEVLKFLEELEKIFK